MTYTCKEAYNIEEMKKKHTPHMPFIMITHMLLEVYFDHKKVAF